MGSLDFDLYEGVFEIIGVDNIVLNACLAVIGHTRLESDYIFLATLGYQLQRAVEKRHYHIVIFVAMPARRGAWRKAPLRHPRAVIIGKYGAIAQLVLSCSNTFLQRCRTMGTAA